MICSETLAEEASSVYSSGKEFAYDHVSHYRAVPIAKGTDKLEGEHQSRRTKQVHERHSPPVRGAVRRGDKGF